MVFLTFDVKNKHIGKIIGVKGGNIKKISKENNVSINISNEKIENDMRKVTISHFSSLEKITKAKLEVLFLTESKEFLTDFSCCKTENETCSICLEDLKTDKNFVTTKCGHKFHFSCLMESLKLNSLCPLCRSQIENNNKHTQLTDERLNQIIDTTILFGLENGYFLRVLNFFPSFGNRYFIPILENFLRGGITHSLIQVKNFLEN